ncbi:hypothetical protein AB0J40_07210 [Amycolatopsis sp. NPDC049691]|uniref:hypothetical protein n=1 Tax=Amycolatopsis sp. NPDC049691 TaxID=3155155 RepID=UPI003413BB90
MNITLLVIGLVFVAAAVVGGGLKAAGIEVSVISSVPRQIGLAIVGAAAIALSALGAGSTSAPTASSPSTAPAGKATTGDPTAQAETGKQPAPPERYIPEFRNVSFTTPIPHGTCRDEDGVTFSADGPKVETDIDSANTDNYTAADFFYSNCNQSNDAWLLVPDENAFAAMDQPPATAEACATAATQRPGAKRILGPSLHPGMGFCLVSDFSKQVVYLAVTQVSGDHSIAWTATGWKDTHSS